MKKSLLVLWIGILALQSCASKKDILYFQDADQAPTQLMYSHSEIQVNDILSIRVTTLVSEASEAYNIIPNSSASIGTAQNQQLSGYLVSENLSITFPILGKIDVSHKSTSQLEDYLRRLLEDGGHLKNPIVIVRILNSKVTILGAVRSPGTYSFTEQNITLPQALGYAGDLDIKGKRHNILVIREENGIRSVGRIDMTQTNWFDSPYYWIKQNDLIVVDPNGPMVKSSGYIANISGLLGVFSILLSTVLLITR